MTGLEEAFYIISIIYMAVMFILIIALVVAVFKIRNKIVEMERQIEDRINQVTGIAEKGGELAAAAVNTVTRRAKKALVKK